MRIRNEILNKTTQCNRDFSCLKGIKPDKNCRVINCLNNEVHFVECSNDSFCSYLMSFGNSFICNCPVRKEIFNKYGI